MADVYSWDANELPPNWNWNEFIDTDIYAIKEEEKSNK